MKILIQLQLLHPLHLKHLQMHINLQLHKIFMIMVLMILEIQRSKILFDNELINFKVTIQDLILDAIEGYLSVIYYEKSLEANQKNFESVSKSF